jgi:hypothetical protein
LSWGLLQQKLNNETHQKVRSLSSVCWDRLCSAFLQSRGCRTKNMSAFSGHMHSRSSPGALDLKPSPHGADTSSNLLYLRHNIQFTPAKGNKQTPTHQTYAPRESKRSLYEKALPRTLTPAHKKSAVRPAAHTSGRRATALLPNKGQIGG